MPMRKKILTRTISVVVSESIYHQLIQLNKHNDHSLSGWIRQAISEKLENLKQK
jgi:hypothetical protein